MAAHPAGEFIRIGDEYYILASAVGQRQKRLILNHGDSFAIFDLAGDIPAPAYDAFGLFYRGTRFLARFELTLNRGLPMLLASAASDDGSELVFHLSNADEWENGRIVLVRDTVSLQRSKTLVDGALHEQLRLHNYGPDELQIELGLGFEADFADVFELRGLRRQRRGERLAPQVEGQSVRLRYRGLDGVVREAELCFPPGWRVSSEEASAIIPLQPRQEVSFEIRICCSEGSTRPPKHRYGNAVAAVRNQRRDWLAHFPRLYSNNEGFNDWLNRSLGDLAMLAREGDAGSYVYAGIPWFATIFGRDGIITALQTLPFAPEIAAGVLRTLASMQGQVEDAERDEQPGKILHEMRYGEMAATGEIPFGRYYGSADATPLFLVLLAEYADRTAELELVRELWPAALAAMNWIDRYGDRDGDGYVEYARLTPKGLVNQGWKDSRDAVFHADGKLAEPPIALAEVQAYVYAARRGLARLARRLDRGVDAATWEAKAAMLREQFNRDFWLPEHEIFALALDRDKRPCRVVSSNAGHCLWGRIAEPDKAARVIARLMREDMFCGWGIRTLSARERRYNPMSYHNGSVWPHDNALIAAGFARYGAVDRAAQILTALFEASLFTEERRLPELYCGFPRSLQHSPVPYPVACKPQAWAAGSVLMVLQAVLGLVVNAWENRVTFYRTALPPWLERLDIHGLRVRDARVDLSIARGHWGAAVEVIDKQGDVEVVVRK